MSKQNNTYQPLFSILIANYNNGCYLQEAIDSVLAQTYPNWEIVLVDDKSSDDSFEIYKKYKEDKRFHIYFNEENKGCGYTKRRCAELAQGELCGFLDPDDKLTPDALEVMVNEHGARAECSLVYSTHYLWNDCLGTKTVQDLVGPMQNGEDFLVSSRNVVSHFSTFKKNYYNKTVGINMKLKSSVDVDEYFLLEEVGELHYVDRPLYYYRQTNPNSVSISGGDAVSKAFNNRMVASLDAFCRRIQSKSMLFKRNKEKYVFRMRWQLGTYKRAVRNIDRPLIRYCYWYWVANNFSLRSLNQVRKILLMKVGR